MKSKYRNRKKLILTDCDGVCLDWEWAFNVWMQEHGFEEIPDSKFSYDMSIRYNITREQVKKLIKEYDVKTAKAQLTECCGDTEKDPTNWKSATAAILTTRLYNYVRHYHKEMSKDNIKQYLEILLHPSFSVDQKYLLVRNTVTVGNQFAAILGSDPRFLKYMLDK